MRGGLLLIVAGLMLGLAADPALAMKGEALESLADMEEKIISLAEATPAEKFTWRPAEGVRSFSEVYVHIAATNYFLGNILGIEIPSGLNWRAMERTKATKPEAIAALKQSMAYIRNGLEAMSEEQLHDRVQFFGKDSSKEAVLLQVVRHAAEHLGQAVAYARMNGIAPPWS